MQKYKDLRTFFFFSFVLLNKFNSNFGVCSRGYLLVFSKVSLAAVELESNVSGSVEVKEPVTRPTSTQRAVG